MNASAENNELSNVNVIKMIMMICVVIYHSMLFYSGRWFTVVRPLQSANYLYEIAKFINLFTMPVFVFCSGYLFFYLRKNMNKYTNFKLDIIKRFKRLIVPYFFTALLWVIPITSFFLKLSSSDIINKYVLAISPSQLWFLIMLFFVFIIFRIIANKLRFSIIEFLIITVLFFVIFYYLEINYFQVKSVAYYSILFYYSGFLINNGKKMLKFVSNNKIFMLLYGIIVLSSMIFYFNVKIYSFFLSNVLLLMVHFLIVTGIYIVIKMSFIYKLENKKSIMFFEEYSFGIYLFHQQLIFYVLYFIGSLWDPLIVSLFCFICGLSISILIVFILKSFKITRNMFGLS